MFNAVLTLLVESIKQVLTFLVFNCTETTLAEEVEATTTNEPEVEAITEVSQVINKDAVAPLVIEKEVTTQPPVKEEVKGQFPAILKVQWGAKFSYGNPVTYIQTEFG